MIWSNGANVSTSAKKNGVDGCVSAAHWTF